MVGAANLTMNYLIATQDNSNLIETAQISLVLLSPKAVTRISEKPWLEYVVPVMKLVPNLELLCHRHSVRILPAVFNSKILPWVYSLIYIYFGSAYAMVLYAVHVEYIKNYQISENSTLAPTNFTRA